MKQFTRRVRQLRCTFFDSRGIVAVVGVILSVVLHECFHLAMHWGNITKIQLFPDSHAIMTVVATTPAGYDVRLEEAVAYGITVITLIATAVVIGNIHDKKDTRTTAQTLLPKKSALQGLSRKEFFELATRIRLL